MAQWPYPEPRKPLAERIGHVIGTTLGIALVVVPLLLGLYWLARAELG